VAVVNGHDDSDSPHIKIQGCPCSLLLKSQEHPAFDQTSTKPLSKYHHKIFSAFHKRELASILDVNKQRKINKEGLQYEITGTSKESAQRQRKPVNKVEKPMKNDKDEASSDSESSEENHIYCQEIFSHSEADEGWVKCSLCGYWAQDACAGVEEEDCDEYSCDMCKNIKQNWLALEYHCSLYNNCIVVLLSHSNNTTFCYKI
jgi:hypothetical protein